MRRLFQYPLSGLSRTIRVILAEKHLDYEMVYETPWGPSDELLEHNISGEVPVLIDTNGVITYGNSAIREYLDEVYPDIPLIGSDYQQRAEARKISDWANSILYNDVYFPVIHERILKRFVKDTDKRPDPSCIRNASAKLNNHMEYIAWLVDRRNWLAGKEFSIADITTASLLSVLDYLGIIRWSKNELVKDWYVRIKSRPSFRSILQDNLPQIPPAENYANLDF